MKKLYTYLAAILLIAGGTLWFYHANAKVCFLAGDDSCNNEASTSNMDPYTENDLRDLCCGSHSTCMHTHNPGVTNIVIHSVVPSQNGGGIGTPIGGGSDILIGGGVTATKPGFTGTINPGFTGVINPGFTGVINPGITHVIDGQCSWYETYPYKNDAACAILNTTDNSIVIGDYCPYTAKYGITCPLKYQYTSACVSPLIEDGRCGKKFACKCSDRYQFYMEDGVCKNDQGYSSDKSFIDGENCTYTTADSSGLVALTRYSKCQCPPSLYPYKTDHDCELATGGDPGKVTVFSGNDDEFKCENIEADANGNLSSTPSYARCKCNTEYYTKLASSCSAPSSERCTDHEGTHVKECCTDNPYICKEDQNELDSEGVAPDGIKQCGCGYGYKIVRCLSGYRLINGKCTKSGCGEAMRTLLELAEDVEDVEVYKDGTLPTKDKIIVGDSIDINSLDVFDNKETVSAQQYIVSQGWNKPEVVQSLGGEVQDALSDVNLYCSSVIPEIKETGNSTYNGKVFDFTGLVLNLKGTFESNTQFTCTNCQVKANGVTFKGLTELKVDKDKYNSPVYIGEYNVFVTGSEINIKGQYRSTDYIYKGQNVNNRLKINIENNNSYTGSSAWQFGAAGKELPVILQANNTAAQDPYRYIKYTDFTLRGSALLKDMVIEDSNVDLAVRQDISHLGQYRNEYCRNILSFSGKAGIAENWGYQHGTLKMCAGSAIGSPSEDGYQADTFTEFSAGGNGYVKIDNSDSGRGLAGIIYKLHVPVGCTWPPENCSTTSAGGGGGTSGTLNGLYKYEWCYWNEAFNDNMSTCVIANYSQDYTYFTKVLKDKKNLYDSYCVAPSSLGNSKKHGRYFSNSGNVNSGVKICTVTFGMGAFKHGIGTDGTVSLDTEHVSYSDNCHSSAPLIELITKYRSY